MSDFASFQKTFKGELVTPSDEGYAASIARWASNAERQAKVVAFAKDAEDVSLAIKYAKAAQLPIAIHTSGHGLATSSSQGGIVIDLSKFLTGVKIDSERKLAYAAGGAIWETVDSLAIKEGLATVGGTVNHIGVGGFTLGGGYGWLTGEHGLACDNLIEATVVTADGSILKANAVENSDLFFGLRGSGSNFGVVTEFVLQLHEQRKEVFAGALVFESSTIEKLAAVTDSWYKSASKKEGMMQMITVGPNGKPVIMSFLFYNGSQTEGREAFKGFFELQPTTDMTREMPYEMVNTLMNSTATNSRAVYMKGAKQMRPSAETMQQTFYRVMQLSEKNEGFRFNAFFDWYPLAKVNSVAKDATAFQRSDASNVLLLALTEKDTPINSSIGSDGLQDLANIIAKTQTDLIEEDKTCYANYAAETTKEHAEAVFGRNYTKLQQLKTKYDPDMTFSKWFAITPA